MKYILTLTLLISVYINGFSQSKVIILNPQIGNTPKLDQNAQSEINRRDELFLKVNLSNSEKEELNALLELYDETIESIWDIIGGGCSWYCGGGPYKVISSSNLPMQGKTSYEAKNASDLSYKTAWIEGVKGYGIGEFIEYYFENNSPRITEIKILNGYIKSDNSWKENARVKKLELSINGEKYAILNLADTKAEQNFKVETLGHRPDKKDLILTFKILDIYEGSKCEDTAITEIYFDGIDVH
jgi:hypothetical protein